MWLSEPVALTSIAAMVTDRHEVRILDLRLEPEDVLARTLSSFRPDIVGTTSMTTDAYQAKAVLRMARRMVPEALTVIGGHMPTLSPAEFDEDYVDVVVQGEGELTFREIVDRWVDQRAHGDRTFAGICGTRWRDPTGVRRVEGKRPQTVDLDALPAPERSLIDAYRGRYFYTAVRPIASIFTSRGCSFDCNFCAIWEFYERRVRYLSAAKIVDQMEACEERFIFVLDDNFLVNKRRLNELCDEMERRGLRKYWMTQGRTDFVADNPDLIRRLAKNGLCGLLSGYETNDDDQLAALRKKSTYDKNIRANRLMAELGIWSTGIFMVRPDYTEAQFDSLYEYSPHPGHRRGPGDDPHPPAGDPAVQRVRRSPADHRSPAVRSAPRGAPHPPAPARSSTRTSPDPSTRSGPASGAPSATCSGSAPSCCRCWRPPSPRSMRGSPATSGSTAIQHVPARRGGAAQRAGQRRGGGLARRAVPHRRRAHPGVDPGRAAGGPPAVGRRGRRRDGGEVMSTVPLPSPATRQSRSFLADLRAEIAHHPAVNHLFLNRLATSPFSRQDYRVFAENTSRWSACSPTTSSCC